ncbi:MAG: hypothetical protein BWY97_00407 [Tenericutes bacterium ADurb.BinA124]|nr:MAG: hypothetical protein BWY97_00407 [Tenericutes bacterium ADurb.BinA124]
MSNLINQDKNTVFKNIKGIMLQARRELSQTVNTTLVKVYWEIGRTIVEDEQNHLDRVEYGQALIKDLLKELNKEFGKRFSRSNLQNMRKLFLTYP